MACPKCGAESMDGAEGLCEPHFEAQRDEIRARLASAGPLPVTKQAPRRKAVPAPSPKQAKQAAWPAAVVIALALFATFRYSGDSEPAAPLRFSQASADETWVITSENVAILKAPQIPEGKLAFLAATVAVLRPGEQVLVIGGRRSDSWKQVIPVSRPSQSGWVLADTVKSAALVGRL